MKLDTAHNIWHRVHSTQSDPLAEAVLQTPALVVGLLEGSLGSALLLALQGGQVATTLPHLLLKVMAYLRGGGERKEG